MTDELRDVSDFRASATLNAAVERLVTARARSGLFFDFDGVLATIQENPDAVQPTEGVRAALEELGKVVGKLALVSSRNAEFLHGRLGDVPELDIYGLYGLEHVEGDGTVTVDSAAQQWLDGVQELKRDAIRELPDVYVEDKKLSVGLHYRLTPELRGTIEEWAQRAAERSGFGVQEGRMVVELKPPIVMDKGSVVTKLSSDLDAAWFFGDDLGDLPAFAALHRKAEEDRRFSALAIGVGNDTIVEQVRAEADVFLESPRLLVELLRYVRQAFNR